MSGILIFDEYCKYIWCTNLSFIFSKKFFWGDNWEDVIWFRMNWMGVCKYIYIAVGKWVGYWFLMNTANIFDVLTSHLLFLQKVFWEMIERMSFDLEWIEFDKHI